MKTRKRTKAMAESALMIAFATVLSIIPLAQLPYGGSITLASMLPIVLISYRHGSLWGVGSGLVFGVIQQLLGLSNLSYFTTWQSIVAIILLDYLLAFGLVGLGGLGRGFASTQQTKLVLGAFAASLLRYLCHVVSGATVWAGLSIPTEAALLYSLAYNATYIIPEAIVLCLSAYYLGGVLDFSGGEIRRLAGSQGVSPVAHILSIGAGFLCIAALVFDTVKVFSCMQNPETGELVLTRLFATPFGDLWFPVLAVTLCSGLASAGMMLLRRHFLK